MSECPGQGPLLSALEKPGWEAQAGTALSSLWDWDPKQSRARTSCHVLDAEGTPSDMASIESHQFQRDLQVRVAAASRVWGSGCTGLESCFCSLRHHPGPSLCFCSMWSDAYLATSHESLRPISKGCKPYDCMYLAFLK